MKNHAIMGFQSAKIIAQINNAVHAWKDYAIKAGVHPLLTQKINEHLNVYPNVH